MSKRSQKPKVKSKLIVSKLAQSAKQFEGKEMTMQGLSILGRVGNFIIRSISSIAANPGLVAKAQKEAVEKEFKKSAVKKRTQKVIEATAIKMIDEIDFIDYFEDEIFEATKMSANQNLQKLIRSEMETVADEILDSVGDDNSEEVEALEARCISLESRVEDLENKLSNLQFDSFSTPGKTKRKNSFDFSSFGEVEENSVIKVTGKKVTLDQIRRDNSCSEARAKKIISELLTTGKIIKTAKRNQFEVIN